jgi:hypothetical protein
MKKSFSQETLSGGLVVGGFAMIVLLASAWTPKPVALDPLVRMPGTQPGALTLEAPGNCMTCHSGYDSAVEPGFNWQGSMMGQTARDPLFFACFTVAAQDSIWALGNPNAADLCMRCHFPKGWLEGRSDPPNASLMTGADYDGVQCDSCHSMYNPHFATTHTGQREGSSWTNYWDESNLGIPTSANSALGVFDSDVLALSALTCFNGQPFATNNVPFGPLYTENGAGQYFVTIADNRAKRAPFTDAQARHSKLYSRYHKSKYFCQTCHDVSNPVFINSASNPTNRLGSELNAPFRFTHVERTSSEFMLSVFGLQGGAAGTNQYAPSVFATSHAGSPIATCQDCHMRDRVGVGCNKRDGILRPAGSLEHPLSGQPVHELTGGNMWITSILASTVIGSANYSATNAALLKQGPAALTLDLTQGLPLNAPALLAAVNRAQTNLLWASSIGNLSYDFVTGACLFRVNNHTGHKLISGFPEGRRIFINIKAFVGIKQVYEINPYDATVGTLRGLTGHLAGESPALQAGQAYVDELVYEMHPSSSVTGEAETFHFALGNGRYKDNRIPPKGFRIAEAAERECQPVWHGTLSPDYFTAEEYAGGFDQVNLTLPQGCDRLEVRLYYQITSREYVAFLRDEINGTGTTLTGLGAGGDPAYLIQSDPWFAKLKVWGNTIWSLWLNNKDLPGAAPVLMSSATMQLNTSDDDNDTIPAYWEIQYFGGPTNATGHADSDHDGVTDYSEYVALTDPKDPASRFTISSATFNSAPSGQVGELSFTSRVARVYQVQTTTNLVAPIAWQSLLPLHSGVEGLMTLSHTNDAERAFYRVGVELP